MNTWDRYDLKFTYDERNPTSLNYFWRVINFNPTYYREEWIEHVFWHEIGHYVALRNKTLRKGMCNWLGISSSQSAILLDTNIAIVQWIHEVYAWRFVAKVMRKRFDRKIMYAALDSYLLSDKYTTAKDDALMVFKYYTNTFIKEG